MVTDEGMASDLLRSGTRLEILRQLQAGSATKYELRERLDCSRTTVDRNLQCLAEDGWITGSRSEYSITVTGEFVLEAATEYLETVEVASTLQPILQWIPRAELDIDIRKLADATVTLPTEDKPLAPVDQHARGVRSASDVRMVLPIYSPQPILAFYESGSLEELSLEIIGPRSVAEGITTDDSIRQEVAEMRAAGSLELQVTESPVPYYLGIVDETVQIGVDDDGAPMGLLEADSDGVLAWAEDRFERFKASATPLED